MPVDLVLEIEETVAVAPVHEVTPGLSVRITFGADPVGIVLGTLGFSDVDDLVLVVVEMTVDVDSEVGVETLVVAYGEFPSLVLELAHVEHRVRTEGDTLIRRNQSGGTVQTVVHPLLEDVEADGELVAQA